MFDLIQAQAQNGSFRLRPGLSRRGIHAAESYPTETENKMMAVELATQPTLKFGAPRMLFVGDYVPTASNIQNYDASHDGRRFLMVQPGAQETTTPTPINVVLNWFEES